MPGPEIDAQEPEPADEPAGEPALEAELRHTQRELRVVKHDLHEAKRVVFSLKGLCEMKDAFYYKQEKRNEELIEKALEQAKAFAALYEANVEAQEEAQEEKPWYDGDGDDPEGFFQVMQDFLDCEWPLDGGASDISETDTSDNEDVEEEENADEDQENADEDQEEDTTQDQVDGK